MRDARDIAHIKAQIATVPMWHHRIPIHGIMTPGLQDTQSMAASLALPASYEGKRVLDIGARDGFFSFDAEAKGATEVVAIDNVSPDRTGFNVARDLLGSKVEYVVDNVYNLNPDRYGKFDVVLFLGVLYHLRHPVLALDNIWDVSNLGAKLYVETHLIDHGLVDPEGQFHDLEAFHPDLVPFPLFEFFPGRTLANDFTSKWAPNQAGLRAVLGATGFDVQREWIVASRGGVTARARELDGEGQRAADAASEWDIPTNRIYRSSKYSPPVTE